MSHLLNPATGPLAHSSIVRGAWVAAALCVWPHTAATGFFFITPIVRRLRTVQKNFPVEGLCTPGTEGVSVREFRQLGGAVLHTGSMHAMAVWGTALHVLTQGGYACPPTAVCPCPLNTYFVVPPTVFPQAAQCHPVGA